MSGSPMRRFAQPHQPADLVGLHLPAKNFLSLRFRRTDVLPAQ
jgi:hypothetical protein